MMLSRTFRAVLIVVLLASLGSTSWAKKKHPLGAGKEETIIEISPASVTVDAGQDVQESYTITGTTRATLDGLPVRPEDLRAGMVAKFVLASDNETIVSMAASHAPRVTKKPVIHPWWWY